MAERGWTLAQVQESIEARKPDFAAYVAPQMEFSDVVISVLPSDISTEAVGKHLKVSIIRSAILLGILYVQNYLSSVGTLCEVFAESDTDFFFLFEPIQVKLIQANGKTGFTPSYILDKEASIKVIPTSQQVKVTHVAQFALHFMLFTCAKHLLLASFPAYSVHHVHC